MPKFEFDVERKGLISDGYHTFDELYYHRMILFLTLCKIYKSLAWKSWKHDDGTMFDNSFIVGIETPLGQYTYHYNEGFYYMFDVEELEFAPKWDGHKPEDVTRLLKLPDEFEGEFEVYANQMREARNSWQGDYHRMYAKYLDKCKKIEELETGKVRQPKIKIFDGVYDVVDIGFKDGKVDKVVYEYSKTQHRTVFRSALVTEPEMDEWFDYAHAPNLEDLLC